MRVRTDCDISRRFSNLLTRARRCPGKLTCGLNVLRLLVGGPEERALCSTLVERVQDPKCVYNLADQLPLGELPGLLTRRALFIGNHIGPKYLAAGLGVPTIGNRSGAVDPYEYLPSGVNTASGVSGG
jgi:hypothetical protein